MYLHGCCPVYMCVCVCVHGCPVSVLGFHWFLWYSRGWSVPFSCFVSDSVSFSSFFSLSPHLFFSLSPPFSLFRSLFHSIFSNRRGVHIEEPWDGFPVLRGGVEAGWEVVFNKPLQACQWKRLSVQTRKPRFTRETRETDMAYYWLWEASFTFTQYETEKS